MLRCCCIQTMNESLNATDSQKFNDTISLKYDSRRESTLLETKLMTQNIIKKRYETLEIVESKWNRLSREHRNHLSFLFFVAL